MQQLVPAGGAVSEGESTGPRLPYGMPVHFTAVLSAYRAALALRARLSGGSVPHPKSSEARLLEAMLPLSCAPAHDSRDPDDATVL